MKIHAHTSALFVGIAGRVEIEIVADDIVMIGHGRIVAQGSITELQQRIADLDVRAISSSISLRTSTIESSMIDSARARKSPVCRPKTPTISRTASAPACRASRI